MTGSRLRDYGLNLEHVERITNLFARPRTPREFGPKEDRVGTEMTESGLRGDRVKAERCMNLEHVERITNLYARTRTAHSALTPCSPPDPPINRA